MTTNDSTSDDPPNDSEKPDGAESDDERPVGEQWEREKPANAPPTRERGRSLRTDERGVSTTLTYVLTIAVTTVLISGLVVAAGTVVGDQRERAARNELTVVGERIATELVGADGLVAGDADAEMRLRLAHPERVVGTSYTVAVFASDPGPCARYPCLALNASDPDETVTVPFVTETPVRPTTVEGGAIRVVYEPANGTLALEESR